MTRRTARPPHRTVLEPPPAGSVNVLIVSADAVAAALLGALVETLGLRVAFATAAEPAGEAFRRTRPRVALVDAGDDRCSGDAIGHATMRGITVLLFGSAAALARVADLAEHHGLASLVMPADVAGLASALGQASTA